MKLKAFFTIALLLVIFSANAQRAKLLKGSWKYADVTEKEKLDSTGLKMLEMFFADMTFSIEENGKYKASFMGKNEEGAWKLNKDESKISFSSSKGQTNEISIVDVDQTKLVINFGGKPNSIILNRVIPEKAGK